jgi:opacity protein-like surface antigen
LANPQPENPTITNVITSDLSENTSTGAESEQKIQVNPVKQPDYIWSENRIASESPDINGLTNENVELSFGNDDNLSYEPTIGTGNIVLPPVEEFETVVSEELTPSHVGSVMLFDKLDNPLNTNALGVQYHSSVTEDEFFKIRKTRTKEKNKGACYSFRELFGGRWYGDIYVGFQHNSRNLKAKNSEYLNYASKRADSESVFEGYTLGMRLSYLFNNGAAIRSGIHYSQLNEEIKIKVGEETIESYREIRDQNGNVIGQDTILETRDVIDAHSNRYRLLDIPIYVGYEYHIDNIALLANAGIHFNALLNTSGRILAEDDSIIDLSSSQSPFKDRIGIGYYASIGLAYKMSPDLQFLVEPYYRTYPNLAKNTYNLNQQYNAFGVTAGLRYRF